MKVWYTKSGYSITCVLSGRSNVFMISGNGKNILIDTSPGSRWEKLKKRLDNLNIKNIELLILTHSHFDHAGNASKIKKYYHTKVIVSKEEAGYLESGETPIPHGTIFITRFIVNRIAPLFQVKLRFEACKPDILTDQYFDLKEYGFNAYIIHTPGHSPGSQCIIVDDEIAIAGDSMFGVFPGTVFPPYADNESELIRSWGKLLETNCYLFLPSHGRPDKRELLIKEFNKRNIS
jgi:hydroxyacylglutathione hydrolase